MIKHTLTKIFIMFQVMLYRIIYHKWLISTCVFVSAELITLAVSLFSTDIGSYSGLMGIFSLSAIASAVMLEISEE